jgi:hypothetical protein
MQWMEPDRSRFMTRTTLLAACVSAAALFAGAPAFAEDQAPPAAPAAAAAAPVEVEVPPAMRLEQGARATAQRSARTSRASRMNADARHCLDLKTNAEVIKCAERYL